MKHVLMILIVALILKDVSHLNDPYIMRGIAESLCLVFGLSWVFANLNASLMKRYWVVFCYFAVLFVSMLLTKNIFYVAFQVVSLFGVVLFAISYFETLHVRKQEQTVFVNTTVHVYFIACAISLLIIPLWSSQAFEILYGGEIRFRGLFSKSGMIASAGGILFGFALYGYKTNKTYYKYIAALFGVLCLLLTQSRTFWGALIGASALTVYLYYPKYKKYSVMLLIFSLVVGVGVLALGLHYDTSTAESALRINSLMSLSGRLGLWELGIENLKGYHWYLGYGFTAGSEGLGLVEGMSSREIGRITLHNGYIQSLLDTGTLGLTFYVLVIFFALRNVVKKDTDRKYPHVFYTVVFLSVANVGEAIIYTASVYHSIVFWFVAIFALSLKAERAVEKSVDNSEAKEVISNTSSVRLRM